MLPVIVTIEPRPNECLQTAERSLLALANKFTGVGTYARSQPFVDSCDKDACLEADRKLVKPGLDEIAAGWVRRTGRAREACASSQHRRAQASVPPRALPAPSSRTLAGHRCRGPRSRIVEPPAVRPARTVRDGEMNEE
ncbi:hypothetical protein GCM10018987_52250 [Streptomyces cremeus]